jgi:hypothetical protein
MTNDNSHIAIACSLLAIIILLYYLCELVAQMRVEVYVASQPPNPPRDHHDRRIHEPVYPR